jgi:hypothetical protein
MDFRMLHTISHLDSVVAALMSEQRVGLVRVKPPRRPQAVRRTDSLSSTGPVAIPSVVAWAVVGLVVLLQVALAAAVVFLG